MNLAILRGNRIWDKVLSIILVMAILAALGILGYIVATPRTGEEFTEFYILGVSGQAADYPKEVKLGEEGRVIVGIANHEGERVSYRIQVRIDGVKDSRIVAVVLDNKQEWEGRVSFTPNKVGDKQKVEFLLYKNEDTEPSLEPLHLWIDVTG